MPKKAKRQNATRPKRRASLSCLSATAAQTVRPRRDGFSPPFSALLALTSVFMDTEAIRASAEWPKAIHRGLQQATHVIAVIGSQWLRVTDDYGRRRIDRDDDWVRTELAHALQQRKRILPIILAPEGMPRAAALPEEIEKLAYVQPFELRNDRWESDLNLLVRELERQGFERLGTGGVRYPTPQVSITEIPQKEFAAILRALPGWTEVVSPLPGQEPLQQIELHKSFEFGSFPQALEFMRKVSEFVVKTQHHPRWENIWRTVSVWLSTWDIGHKPSKLDVDLAREMERIYRKYDVSEKQARSSGLRKPVK